MYLYSSDRSECCGCFACVDACPKEAIKIESKDDGFLYPTIDLSKCVNCKKCERICERRIRFKKKSPVYSFAGIVKDNDAFLRSSSGGAFEAIIQAIYEEKGCNKQIYVVGAMWDDGFRVVHKSVDYNDKTLFNQLCKSKYVQSNLEGIYSQVKMLLDSGNYVVFSGTPCQVSALLSFLGKGRDNLFTIDLICRGAPSQNAFDVYKDNLETEYGAKLIRYFFRNKEILDNGTLYTRSALYQFDNGKTVKATRYTDSYLKAFYEKRFKSRPACKQCEYTSPVRVADITIGDAWGIEELYPEINGIRGVSAVIINSEIAKKLIPYLYNSMTIYECDYSFMIHHNAALNEVQV